MKNKMEELQVIETTSGRQFKPWATKDDVQDPASVTAIASEIAGGKQAIASAINAKGGQASLNQSFSELADDIVNLNDSFITYGVEVTEKIHWLRFICDAGTVPRLPLTAIDDDVITAISQTNVFRNCSALESVKMTALTTISGVSVFQGCSALQEINMPNLITISGNSVFSSCRNLKIAKFPKCSNYSGQYMFEATGGLINIVFGTLTQFYSGGLFYGRANNLRNITIGQDTNISLPFHEWTATNVIAEGQSGIDELNTNLQTNLISKLYQGGGKILRLGAALYDVTTQETRDMVTSKGWTLQRG